MVHEEKNIKSKHKKKFFTKRETILRSAVKIFSLKGYNKTSIEEIAEGADFGKGSIYHYFRSKEEIFDAIIYEKCEKLLSLINSAYNNDEMSPIKKLKEIISKIMTFLHDNLDFFLITIGHFYPFQTEPMLSPQISNIRYQSFYEKQNSILTNVLKEGQKKGDIIPMDTQEMVTILTGMINYSIIYWINNRPSKDFLEWMNLCKTNETLIDFFPKKIEILIHIFLNGISLDSNEQH